MLAAGDTPGASGDAPAASAATAVPWPSSLVLSRPGVVPRPTSSAVTRVAPNVASPLTPVSRIAIVVPRPHVLRAPPRARARWVRIARAAMRRALYRLSDRRWQSWRRGAAPRAVLPPAADECGGPAPATRPHRAATRR